MNSSNVLSDQSHRMLQIGIGLFVFSGLEGFAIPRLASPPLGRSAHTLSALQGVMALTLGLFWPRLHLGAHAARIAFWTYNYSSFATLVPFMLAAVWGAGKPQYRWPREKLVGTPFRKLLSRSSSIRLRRRSSFRWRSFSGAFVLRMRSAETDAD